MTFSATDDTGVTGYQILGSEIPTANDPNWSPIASTTYTFTNTGNDTICGWAKDAAGNLGSSCASVTITLDPCYGKNIGDESAPGGSICAGEFNGSKYMVTPSDEAGVIWSDDIFVKVGNTSTTNGAANTAILANLTGSYPAASYCANLSFGGYNDWFLPAMDELNNVLYVNKNALGMSDSYWSSTETSFMGDTMNVLVLQDGERNIGVKNNTIFNIRCVRSY